MYEYLQQETQMYIVRYIESRVCAKGKERTNRTLTDEDAEGGERRVYTGKIYVSTGREGNVQKITTHKKGSNSYI